MAKKKKPLKTSEQERAEQSERIYRGEARHHGRWISEDGWWSSRYEDDPPAVHLIEHRGCFGVRSRGC